MKRVQVQLPATRLNPELCWIRGSKPDRLVSQVPSGPWRVWRLSFPEPWEETWQSSDEDTHGASDESKTVEFRHKAALKAPAAPPRSPVQWSTRVLHSVHALNGRRKTFFRFCSFSRLAPSSDPAAPGAEPDWAGGVPEEDSETWNCFQTCRMRPEAGLDQDQFLPGAHFYQQGAAEGFWWDFLWRTQVLRNSQRRQVWGFIHARPRPAVPSARPRVLMSSWRHRKRNSLSRVLDSRCFLTTRGGGGEWPAGHPLTRRPGNKWTFQWGGSSVRGEEGLQSGGGACWWSLNLVFLIKTKFFLQLLHQNFCCY